MIPKRKLIKKKYIPGKQKEQLHNTSPQTLTEMLKSTDTTIKHEAISIIANLQPLPSIVTHPSTLLELINMLYSQNNVIINSILFAMDHICFQSPSSIQALFKLGLDKALISLNFDEETLHIPILILITTLAADIPAPYEYFFQGVQKTLASPKYLQSADRDLVMEFLIRSKYAGELPASVLESANTDRRFYVRALSTCLLVTSTRAYNAEFIELFKTTFNEFLLDIDLEREFRQNIEENMTEKATIAINNKTQFTGMQEEGGQEMLQFNEPSQKVVVFFQDPFEGLRFMFEFVSEILQEDDKFEDNEEDDEEMMEEEQGSQVQWHEGFSPFLMNLLEQNINLIKNNLLLTFPDGHQIVQAILRLFLLLSEKNKETIVPIVEESIISMCKSHFEKQNLAVTLNIALRIILKNKQIINRALYPDLGTHILKIEKLYKECWLTLLQIYSLKYNPEKCAVSAQQNGKIGMILKKLITDIPELELEQWRGQTIDTVFDVFSNQKFDDNFMSLGFLPLLQQLYKAGQVHQKKKKSKFIRAVVEDIKRFIMYKNEHIKH